MTSNGVKLHLPKIKFKLNLARVSAVILVLGVSAEVFVLYQAFLAPVPLPQSATEAEQAEAINFDLEEYQKIQNLMQIKKLYEVPDYSLEVSTTTASTTVTTGRENPFADY